MTCEMLRKKNGVQIALSDHLKQVRLILLIYRINLDQMCCLICLSREGRLPRQCSAWSWSSPCAGCLSTSAASWSSPFTTRRIQTAVSCSGTGACDVDVPQCSIKRCTCQRRMTDPVVLFSFFLVLDYIGINMASVNSCINPLALYMVSKRFKSCFRVRCSFETKIRQCVWY